jgi:CheY-like chemotaxis protein
MSPRVLVIDDEPQMRTMVRRLLEHAGYGVTEAENGLEGLAACAAETPLLVVTDLYMPQCEGLETIMKLRREHREVPIVAMSGGGMRGSVDQLETAVKLGAAATLVKPFRRQDLLAAVEQALASTAAKA